MSRLEGEVNPALLDDAGRLPVTLTEGLIPSALEMPIFFADPFSVSPDVFVPNEKVLVWERFVELVERVIDQAQTNQQVERRVKLIAEYPHEDFHNQNGEVITWRLMYRQPASTAPNGAGSKMPQWKHSHHLRISDDPTKVVSVEYRLVDHNFALTCWSSSARVANARALWLERLMINNTWVFQQQGADFFQWKRRLADTYQTTGGVRLFFRTLEFDVRLPEFRIKADPMLQSIQTELEVGLPFRV
jgi:hypothetical protein